MVWAGVVFWICVAFLFYIYAGYPILVYLFSLLRPPEEFHLEETRPVTLLIAAYNEENDIEKKLENSLRLDYPQDKLQIMVVADGSTDRTVEIVKGYAKKGVELYYQPKRKGKQAAISRVIDHVRGEVIVFSDANNFYGSDLIKVLTAPFSDPRVGATSGAKMLFQEGRALSESEGLYWRYESWIKRSESRLVSCVAVSGEVWAIRKELFKPLPEGTIIDDFNQGMSVIRQGYRIAYVPEARSYEMPSASTRYETIRRARITAGRLQGILEGWKNLPVNNPVVMWEVISHKVLRIFIPFFMIGAFLANLGACLFPSSAPGASWLYLSTPVNQIFLALQGVFYLTALLGQRCERANTKIGKLFYLPAYLCYSSWATLLGVVQYFFGHQTPLWQRVPRYGEKFRE